MVEQINYEGAGTVEYMKMESFILEMNTRVQAEHPVTEVQTGIDIVKEQLWIALLEIALKQSDINPRVILLNAEIVENPALDFQPVRNN